MGSLRVTADLHRLLKETASHTKLDVSDVIRRTVRGILNGRPVVRFAIGEMYYRKPAETIRVREFTMPAGIDPEEFRRLLAMRCLEELQKPGREQKPRPEIEGIDYIVEELGE
jgi:hypothetical protein